LRPGERLAIGLQDRCVTRETNWAATSALARTGRCLGRTRRANDPGVVARRSLLDEVWAYDDGVQTRTVDTHVVELRRKIESDPAHPRYIVTVRKAGYMLRVGSDA